MRTTRIIKINDSSAELGVESIGDIDSRGQQTRQESEAFGTRHQRCREEQMLEPETVTTNELKDVPPKQLFNYNLKQLKSFKKIRQSYKLKNLKYTFLTDMKVVLNEYLPTDKDNQYNDELLIEVLNIAEEYFINKDKTEREVYKKDCVIELLLPYFNNDKQLLQKTMQLVDHKVKKVGLIKRLYLRAKIFFCNPNINTKTN
jgi:hypothetical protein